ncbi:MAG: lytic transglycosylase domain-containing protein [Hyphomicrobiaceae bacterium]
MIFRTTGLLRPSIAKHLSLAFPTIAIAACLLVLAARPGLAESAEKALDEALKPLLSGLPREAELASVKAAILQALRKDYQGARDTAAGITDPTALKLFRWYEMRVGAEGISPAEILQFVEANPDWPNEGLIEEAEEILFLSKAGPKTVGTFFASRKPATGPGKAALAEMLANSGDKDGARRLVVEAWRNDPMSAATEEVLIARLGSFLTPADHKWRADRLAYQDSRWKGVRDARVGEIRRLLPLLLPADRAMIEARLAVYQCTSKKCMGGKKKLFDALPAAARTDPGIVYHNVQRLRRTEQNEAAWTLLLTADMNAPAAIDPDAWWIERRVNLYNALYAGKPRIAYRLAAEHGPLSVNELNDAEFFAGWIALRFLDDPKTARGHFEAMRRSADGPNTRSTAAYWLARTLDALGDKAGARTMFEEAGRDFTAFYGQLARHMLDREARALPLAAPRLPPAAVVARFKGRDAARALVIARKAGLTDVMRVFLSSLRFKLGDEGEMTLLAHLALDLGDTQMSVRIAKTAIERGFDLVSYAYPIDALPQFKPLRPLPETAIFYAIARQESEFNTLTVSGAGAKGILQVMPVTARHVCQQYKIKCDLQKLTSDPAFNARLATAYIADRHDDFGGSYIMAFAGYNAGPGRVRYWMKQIGDPRDPGVDPLDWIESIHIEETRSYVKKVLSNLIVYRARLGHPETALQIREDLMRARRKSGGGEAAN